MLFILQRKKQGFGNCVFVNNTPANMEVPGDAGIWFDGREEYSELCSKINQMFEHPEIVNMYGIKAMDRVEKEYSWDMVTEKIMSMDISNLAGMQNIYLNVFHMKPKSQGRKEIPK